MDLEATEVHIYLILKKQDVFASAQRISESSGGTSRTLDQLVACCTLIYSQGPSCVLRLTIVWLFEWFWVLQHTVSKQMPTLITIVNENSFLFENICVNISKTVGNPEGAHREHKFCVPFKLNEVILTTSIRLNWTGHFYGKVSIISSAAVISSFPY